MYIHLGQNTVVREEDIVGIFDLDTSTVSIHTRKFLSKAEKQGDIINITTELPKSFVLINENGKRKIYISQLSSQTLEKRSIANNSKFKAD